MHVVAPPPLHLSHLLVPLIVVLAACARPLEYPRCANDADCSRERSGRFTDQHCVFGQCQTCADDSHCGPGEVCRTGRCGSEDTRRGVDAPSGHALPAEGCPERRPVRFQYGSTSLDEDAKAILGSLRRCRIAGATSPAIIIVGDDAERGVQVWKSLSDARSAEVYAYLRSIGIAAQDVKTIRVTRDAPRSS